jgi:GGDEF domain-containing protein
MQRRIGPSTNGVPAGPTLSPAEFATALTELYARPSLQSLCDAAAHLGTAALGPTWVALFSRGVSDDPLWPAAASGPDQARWVVEPPQIPAEQVPALFGRLAGRALTAASIAALLDGILPADTVSTLQDALQPSLAALAPVVVDGQGAGAVLIATRGDLPAEAVQALAEHTATAMRGLVQIDRLRAHGDRDAESELLSRSAFERTASREMMRARRYGRPLSLIVVTPAEPGAQRLRATGQHLQRALRETDSVGRLDDERLVVLLPETERDAAHAIARRIRDLVAAAQVGVANHPADGATWEALLAVASKIRPSPAPAAARSAVPAPRQPASAEWDNAPSDRFPRHDGPPPRLRDVFPSFRSRAAG